MNSVCFPEGGKHDSCEDGWICCLNLLIYQYLFCCEGYSRQVESELTFGLACLFSNTYYVGLCAKPLQCLLMSFSKCGINKLHSKLSPVSPIFLRIDSSFIFFYVLVSHSLCDCSSVMWALDGELLLGICPTCGMTVVTFWV